MPTIRQKQSTYAITILTFQRHRHFQRTANAELFITILFQHRNKSRFQLHGFAVMPDHIHVLVTPAINESTAKCIQYIKGGYSFAARQQSPGKSGTAAITNTA
jgi:putative transposase